MVYLAYSWPFRPCWQPVFSINNLGAIVRYGSIVMPLMIIPVVGQTDWSRIVRTLLGKNKTIILHNRMINYPEIVKSA